MATPILFEATPKLLTREKITLNNTLYLTRTLKRQLDEQLSKLTPKANSIKTVGTIGILGGFSVTKSTRKPIYAALDLGSILELTRNTPYIPEEHKEVYAEGLGLYRNIGYDTVIPIPLENPE